MRVCAGLVVAAFALTLSLPVRAGTQQDQVYRPGEGIVTPKVLKEVKPDYPPAALIAHVEGIVTLECVVKPDGSPADIRVITPLHPQLDDAASQALARWMFVPGTKD